MSTKMLINAQRAQQVRVAIVADSILRDYQVEVADRDLCRGNIYRGVVANIQPSLNAAFIDIGEERHGFLPVADVLASAYHKKPPKDARRPRIDQVLEKGKTVVVQVTKDGVGQKGPALTTNVALAGRYLVFTPFDDVRGISRKAEDDAARKTVRERLKKLSLPDGNGVIVRTNGLEQNQTTLNRDLNALIRLWKKIKTEIGKGRGPRFLYSDQNLIVQALRDYLDKSISEVVVDDPEVHAQVTEYLRTFMPRTKIDLSLYSERLPLFSRYRLETQIDRIYERQAPLPSGGYLVIDNTEALTAIDVNSGRATRNNNHDESILNTNLESAQEVARQLRLRDIGGLVVVDFIDMRLRKHQHKLEKEMRDAMKDDKARYSVGRISSNGLLEINRQRIKQAIRLRTHRSCPTCDGVGTIASGEFAALNLLGRIESRVATGLVDRVTVALHPEIADTLQNHYRGRLAQLEEELELTVEIISAPGFARLEERLDFHQREEGISPRARSQPALTATDLTMPANKGRRRAADDEDESEESRSRRKRRRRRSSRSKDEDVTTQEEAQATELEAQDDAAEDGEDDNERKPRRRRRRRRSGKGQDQEAQADGQDTPDDDDSDSTKKAPKPRGRFARTEERDEYAAVHQLPADLELPPDVSPPPPDALIDSADTSEAAAAAAAGNSGAAEGDDEDRPKRPRRRRRRRRGRRSDEDEAQAGGEETPAEMSPAPQEKSNDSDDDEKPAPRSSRSRRRRSDSRRGGGDGESSDGDRGSRGGDSRSRGGDRGNRGGDSGNAKEGRKRRSRRAVDPDDDNIGNRSDAEPTHTTTSLALPSGNGDGKKDARRRRSRSRRRSGDAKIGNPPDIAKGDIILPDELPGGHAPGAPPPRRTGISTQRLRWQWWGGNDDKGGE